MTDIWYQRKMAIRKRRKADKFFAALCYFWILFLIPFLIRRKSKYVCYHRKQGFLLFIFTTIVGFVYWIPVFGWALGLLVLILFIIGLANSLSGKKEPLPFIGRYAEWLRI